FQMSGYNLIDPQDEARARETVLEYLNFLDDSAENKVYVTKVEEMINDDNNRLLVNLNDLRLRLPERAAKLVTNFVEEIVCLEQATLEMVQRADSDFAKAHTFHVGFEGSFGDRHVNPRSLKSHFLGNMVCCEGIVTKCSSVRPKVAKSVHYCPATKKTLERNYTDLTSYSGTLSSNVYPTEDENKNPLETEFGLSVYKDHQSFSIQELPECAPPGQLPRSVDVIADDDLSDRVKPGDRVRIVGLYRVLPNKQNGASSGSFRSIMIANNIQLLTKEEQPNFDPEDIRNIRKLSKNKNIFDILARSLAPSIYGHPEVKKAILCLLLGGLEKILDNGSRLRGDVNVLLIGDPSVAKSQLLRYVLHTAPRAITTTGRGSSGVGLTAAVTTDSDSGERRLEAGAMVLADRGIVCIDEFDKMSDIDRTAIHEVMEQGRVTIAKAGIHAKLNARCSVLAAANPVYGRYDPYKSPMENINMQDSLLSRFDLIFVLLDEHDPSRDRTLADHVLKMHRYRTPGEPDGTVLPMGARVETMSTFDLDGDEGKTTDIYEKDRGWTAVDQGATILSMAFMKKYIHVARACKPQLTTEATEFISDCYSEIRSFDTSKTDRERTMPVTARQLETLIRLSTAIAKARLSKTVDRIDAEKAHALLFFACYKEKPKERMEMDERKKRKAGGGGKADEDSGMEEDDEEVVPKSKRNTRRKDGDSSQSTEDESSQGGDEDMDTTEATEAASSQKDSVPVAPAAKRAKKDAGISVDRYKSFKKYIRKAFDSLGADGLHPVATVSQFIQKEAGKLSFTEDELEAAYSQFTADNMGMITDDKIILV
ncbi:hypothetical protein PENTCL1PPCAC_27325, partial [Pristionchus entomophagus]